MKIQFVKGSVKSVAGFLAVALLTISSVVFALDLDSAKAQGQVGETDTGYLAAVSVSAEVNALVADINAKRKAEYQRIASQNGIALTDVEKLAAQKAISKTQAGQYVNIGGSWQKK